MSEQAVPEGNHSGGGSHRVILAAVLLVLAAVAVYSPIRHHSFIAMDDGAYVESNEVVKGGLTAHGVRWAFGGIHVINWHPITLLSHMADVSMFGLNAGGHHLVSLLIHVANTLLLFFFLNRVTGAFGRSALVAAWFSLHPLHVEPVAWIADRKDLLCGFFFLLTLFAYRRYVERPGISRYLAVAFFFLLGLMSKSTLITLPFVLLLLDYWPLGNVRPSPRPSFAKLAGEKAPLLALSIVFGIIAVIAQNEGGALDTAAPLLLRIENSLIAYATYIGKTLWPANLAVLYPYPASAPPLWEPGAAAFLLAGVSALVLHQARRRPYLLVGWFWFLGMLLPAIGLVRVGVHFTADRFVYLPLTGLFIMVAWGGADIAESFRRGGRLAAAIATASLLALAPAARAQVEYWRNGVTLFSHTLAITSDNWLIRNNLGVELNRLGKTEEAVAQYRESLRIQPNYSISHYNLATLMEKTGKDGEAAVHYREAQRLAPNDPDAADRLRVLLNNMGTKLADQGRYEEAIACYREALQIMPDYADAHFNLASDLEKTGRKDEAISHYREVMRLTPGDPDAPIRLRRLLQSQGDQ